MIAQEMTTGLYTEGAPRPFLQLLVKNDNRLEETCSTGTTQIHLLLMPWKMSRVYQDTLSRLLYEWYRHPQKPLHCIPKPAALTPPSLSPQDAASACRKFIERDPEEARFALVALASAAEQKGREPMRNFFFGLSLSLPEISASQTIEERNTFLVNLIY